MPPDPVCPYCNNPASLLLAVTFHGGHASAICCVCVGRIGRGGPLTVGLRDLPRPAVCPEPPGLPYRPQLDPGQVVFIVGVLLGLVAGAVGALVGVALGGGLR